LPGQGLAKLITDRSSVIVGIQWVTCGAMETMSLSQITSATQVVRTALQPPPLSTAARRKPAVVSQQLPASLSADDRRKKRSDTEEADLLPEKKRRKLQQLGCNVGRSGRRGRRAARGTAASQLDTAGIINLDSDEDSDRQLLREAGRGATASSAAAPSAAAAAAAAVNGTAAPRAARRQGSCGAGLDPRSAALLQQAQAIQQRLKAAQEDVLSDDDSELLGGCCRNCLSTPLPQLLSRSLHAPV
jgi:hypothetical protein